MVVCKSSNQENIDFAREHGVWQTAQPHQVKIGEKIALQLTGTKDILVVGIVTAEMREEPPYAWPGGRQDFKHTIRFKPIDLRGQQPFRRVL